MGKITYTKRDLWLAYKTYLQASPRSKTIHVTIEMEVDRNEFVASRLVGESFNQEDFEKAEPLFEPEYTEHVSSLVWTEVVEKLSDLHGSITIKEEA
tara:strand:+ start:10502 stop:10792 length:291 start_codon:yes stop_codon:yes gene_type:complete